MTEWRGGQRGALAMGLRHGAVCVGCCWVLMLLLFVGGVMNVIWIAGIAAFVLVEKTAPAGHWWGRVIGVALVTWGGAHALLADLIKYGSFSWVGCLFSQAVATGQQDITSLLPGLASFITL